MVGEMVSVTGCTVDEDMIYDRPFNRRSLFRDSCGQDYSRLSFRKDKKIH